MSAVFEPHHADEVAIWRGKARLQLLQERAALAPEEHAARSASVCARVLARLATLDRGWVGAYWPFRGEVDLRPLFEPLLQQGVGVALPVVEGRTQPLGFRAWAPGSQLRASPIGVLEPVDGASVEPEILLIPVVGYDRSGYRLGYGGGFYDRTLRGASSRPLALGIGFTVGALATIYPQPWDVPMDAILTEEATELPILPEDAPSAPADRW